MQGKARMTNRTFDLGKRRFLQGAASAVALTLSGVRAAYAQEAYDVIVIGAGTAGLPLAIGVAERGGRVLVIEKSGQIGGTLFLSGGQMAAAGTRIQKEKSIKDTPDLFFEDVMRLSHKKADVPIVRNYVDNATATIAWLEGLGFRARDTDPIMGDAHADFRVPRYFQGPESGRSILKVLRPPFLKAVASGRIRILNWTGAAELVLASDRSVAGVIAEDENGVRTQYSARSVAITSGGYCANLKKFKELTGRNIYSRAVYPFSQGHGIGLGVAAGGFVRGGECQVVSGGLLADRNYPSPAAVGSGPSTEGARIFGTLSNADARRRPPWEIRINKNGQRFFAEDSVDVDYSQRAFTEQPEQRAWTIFDQEIADKAPPLIRGSKEEVAALFDLHPMFFAAPTLAELAGKIGVPATALTATVNAYNASVAGKKDAAFGRQFLPSSVARGPFYAIEHLGMNVIGYAGLAVDKDMRVLRGDGSPVRNLYAAGEVIGAAATCGDTMVSGGCVTPAVTFGRLLGQKLLPVKA